MLKKLRLHNFRTYLNAEIEFGRRHLLIGKNNSGKTNLGMAIRFLGASASTKLTEAIGMWVPGGIQEFTNWAFKSNTADFSIACELPFENDTLSYQYDLTLQVASASRQSPPGALELNVEREKLAVSGGRFHEECLLDNNGAEVTLLHEEQVGGSGEAHRPRTPAPQDATMLSNLNKLETNRRAILFRQFLRAWASFTLSPNHMRYGWRQPGQSPALAYLGENLATGLFHLKNQDERRYRRLLNRVRPFEAGLDAINFHVAPDQGILPFVSLSQKEQASWLGLSDGTLRALGLSYIIEIADLLSQQEGAPPPLIVIEEPENGIYGGLLRKLLEEFDNCAPEAQFIFTSHSPYFIDLFDHEPSAVTLLRRERERTVVQRLSAKETVPPADADRTRWQTVKRDEIEVFPGPVQDTMVCGVAVNNTEEWLSLEPSFVAEQLGIDATALHRASDRSSIIKRAIERNRAICETVSQVVERLVIDAPGNVFKQWLKDPALRDFYSECRRIASQFKCETRNEL